MDINENTIITRTPGIILQKEPDNWGFLYDPEKDISYGVNRMTIYIWLFLETNPNFNILLEKIKANFTQVPDEMEEDIKTILTGLAEQGLITIQTPPPGETK